EPEAGESDLRLRSVVPGDGHERSRGLRHPRRRVSHRGSCRALPASERMVEDATEGCRLEVARDDEDAPLGPVPGTVELRQVRPPNRTDTVGGADRESAVGMAASKDVLGGQVVRDV